MYSTRLGGHLWQLQHTKLQVPSVSAFVCFFKRQLAEPILKVCELICSRQSAGPLETVWRLCVTQGHTQQCGMHIQLFPPVVRAQGSTGKPRRVKVPLAVPGSSSHLEALDLDISSVSSWKNPPVWTARLLLVKATGRDTSIPSFPLAKTQPCGEAANTSH